jgi:DNA-binding transcriptional MerR regulator
MGLTKDELGTWLSEMQTHRCPEWEKLPEIELYMDQVTALLERYLDIFMRDTDDKLITSSMVNNYVKQGLIEPPIKKKYSRKHIAYLMTVCILKQVLPISTIASLLDAQEDRMEVSELFNLFCAEQDDALKGVAQVVANNCSDIPAESLDAELSLLALKLTVTANANRLAAEKILNIIKSNGSKKKKEPESKAKS